MNTRTALAVRFVALLLTTTAWAEPALDWKWELSPSVTGGSYQDSATRRSYLETGITLGANYRDQGGLKLGVSTTTIGKKNGAPDTEQSSQLLSGYWTVSDLTLGGRWTARLDLHGVRNNDQSGITDGASVWAPQLSWLSVDRTLYADLGLAQSRYQGGLTVNQATPTLGIGFNNRYDWLQLRSYQISGLNPALSAGKTSTSAFEAKWTHYFAPGTAGYLPTFLTAGLMGGERIYAVDMDAQSVANLPDLHTGSATLGAGWQLAKSTRLFVLLGHNRFRDSLTDTAYRLNVAHATVSFDF